MLHGSTRLVRAGCPQHAAAARTHPRLVRPGCPHSVAAGGLPASSMDTHWLVRAGCPQQHGSTRPARENYAQQHGHTQAWCGQAALSSMQEFGCCEQAARSSMDTPRLKVRLPAAAWTKPRLVRARSMETLGCCGVRVAPAESYTVQATCSSKSSRFQRSTEDAAGQSPNGVRGSAAGADEERNSQTNECFEPQTSRMTLNSNMSSSANRRILNSAFGAAELPGSRPALQLRRCSARAPERLQLQTWHDLTCKSRARLPASRAARNIKKHFR